MKMNITKITIFLLAAIVSVSCSHAKNSEIVNNDSSNSNLGWTDPGAPADPAKEEVKYYAIKKITSEFTDYGVPQPTKETAIVEFTYSGNKLSRVKVSGTLPGQGDSPALYEDGLVFDDSGRLITNTITQNSDPAQSGVISYTYDDTGFLSGVKASQGETVIVESSAIKEDGKTVWPYKKGNETLNVEITFNADGLPTEYIDLQKVKRSFEYDGVKLKSISKEPTVDKEISKLSVEYDESGNTKQLIKDVFNGANSSCVIVRAEEIDERGLLLGEQGAVYSNLDFKPTKAVKAPCQMIADGKLASFIIERKFEYEEFLAEPVLPPFVEVKSLETVLGDVTLLFAKDYTDLFGKNFFYGNYLDK